MDKPNKHLVCRKVLPRFIRACFKNGPDILGLQVQPELVGVNLVCLWNFMSVIVSSEQLVSYVLWNLVHHSMLIRHFCFASKREVPPAMLHCLSCLVQAI